MKKPPTKKSRKKDLTGTNLAAIYSALSVLRARIDVLKDRIEKLERRMNYEKALLK